MLYGILIALQMIISVLMVVVILLQSSKGGGLAGIAGGAMSSSVFGGRGAANFLSKATTVLAALFMLNCLGMAVLSTARTNSASVTQQAVSQEAPVSPVPSMPAAGDAETTPPPAAEPTPTQE
ncbi:MAG: preprotein translocase subunit SecG [Calditrichota bacterium]